MDFSTEPEFDEKLQWMREFVREIMPIEPIAEEVSNDDLERIWRSLQPQVRERASGRRTSRPSSAAKGSAR